MYYRYLDREQPYLRSYRTHNLWFDQYLARTQRVTHFHLGFFKRMGKSHSGVSFFVSLIMTFLSYRSEF